MANYTDTNGFPEAGFPVLSDTSDRLVLNTLYAYPIKALGFIMDVNGPNRLLGALTIGGALSGVAALTMNGALSGVTTLAASGTVTLSSATAPLVLSGANAVLSMTGANAGIGSQFVPIPTGYFKNLILNNRPTIGGDPLILQQDLQAYSVPYTNALNDVNLGAKKIISAELDLEVGATTKITKDGSNNMVFTDAVTGAKTLAQLAAGGAGGVTKLAVFYADASTSGTGETDLYSYSIPANTLSSDGDTIQFDCTIISGSASPSGNVYITLGGYNKSIQMYYGSVPHMHKIVFTRISSTKVRFSYYALTSISVSYYEEPSTTYDFTSAITIKIGASASSGTATARMGCIIKY